jgi:putative transposase
MRNGGTSGVGHGARTGTRADVATTVYPPLEFGGRDHPGLLARVHGELQKLGLEISQATVSKYLVRRRTPPSQTWRTFLDNHIGSLVSVDFFTVPTVLFKVLFVFVVLAHNRRRVVHVNVTDAPTARWTAQQLVEAFPWDTAPRDLLRDRDAIYGAVFSRQVQALGIHEVTIAPRAPWQNPYVERLIGTLRRECLDHVVVLNATHRRRLLRDCRVEGWRGTPCARLQPPPDRTPRTVFPYAALLPASCQGL